MVDHHKTLEIHAGDFLKLLVDKPSGRSRVDAFELPSLLRGRRDHGNNIGEKALDGWEMGKPTGSRMSMPVSYSQAEVTYRKGDARIEAVSIADLAAFAQRYFTRAQRTQLIVAPKAKATTN